MKALTATLSAVLLTSCATFDPYVRKQWNTESLSDCAFNKTGNSYKPTDPAIQYADAQICVLEMMRSTTVRVQTGSEVGIIPLAALVGYRAARMSHTTGALAAGGVAGYGVAQVLAQQGRLEIYSAGITAIDCATQKYDNAIGTAMSAADDALAALDTQYGILQSELLMEQKSRDPDARDLATNLLESSRVTLGAAHAHRNLNGTTKGLIHEVDLINDQVSKAVNTTLPSLSDLGSFNSVFTGNIGGIAKAVAPPPPPPAPPAAPRTSPLQTSTLIAHANFKTLANAVTTALSDVSSHPTVDYTECSLPSQFSAKSVPSIKTTLNIGTNNNLNGKSAVLTKAKPLTFFVSGGTPAYVIHVVTQPAGATVSISQNLVGTTSEVTIKTDPDLAAGTQVQIEVADQAGQTGSLTVKPQ